MDIKEAIRNYRAEAADLDAEREGQERAAECKQLIVWLGELLALQEKDNSIEVVVYHVIQEIHQRGGWRCAAAWRPARPHSFTASSRRP